MFKLINLFKNVSKVEYLVLKRWKCRQNVNHLYYWNQFNVFTNINETIGSHQTQSHFRNKNLISKTGNGLYVLLPFVERALKRLTELIDRELLSIGAQKLVMPSLVSKQLWLKSGRWEQSGEELFRITDRQKNEFCLAPTHEEVVTQLVASAKHISENHLPLYLYQISSKFRDETKAKHGLLRGRQFLMKDLYTFDANETEANKTYEKVCNSYENIFKELDLKIIKARGSVGSIGGKYSHEFLLDSDLGEDLVYKCNECQTFFNKELVDEQQDVKCVSCGGHELTKLNGIEVGHAFLLGNKYSDKFDAKYVTKDNKTKEIYEMGCYGLGVTRILAASVEVLSKDNSIRWPKALAPFNVCCVLPKKGSKEDSSNGTEFLLDFAKCLSESFCEDILIDDRTHLTIGKRLVGLESLGIPYVIIAGKRINEEIPKFEVIDSYKQQNYFLTHLESIQFIENNL